MDELGKNFWWKTVGLVIGLGILGLISMLIFTGLIARFGAIAALIIIFAIFMRGRVSLGQEAAACAERGTSSTRQLTPTGGALTA